jgi:tol-pal system protein YbgF
MSMVLNYKSIIAFSLFLILAGCAAPLKDQVARETVLPELDVDQVRKNTEEALKQSMTVKLDAELLAVKVADLDERVISLTEDLSNVSSARFEEIETRLTLITEAIKNQQAQMQQLEAVMRGGPMPAVSITGVSPGTGTTGDSSHGKGGFWGTMPGQKGAGAGQGVGATFSPSSAAALIFSPEYDVYQAGLRLFGNHKYQLAIKTFEGMLQQFPEGKYADNANYWIGESYFALEEYSSGIGYFEKVMTFNGSSKIDDAQYKLGLSYLKMGQQPMAKEIFRKFLEQNPGSEFSTRVQRYLKQLR